MATAEERLAALGYVLPQPLKLPPDVTLPFPWVRVMGSRAIVSGHGPTNSDGSLAQPLGKVGVEVTEEEAYVAARLTGLAILGSLKRELGSLETHSLLVAGLRHGQLRRPVSTSNPQSSTASPIWSSACSGKSAAHMLAVL